MKGIHRIADKKYFVDNCNLTEKSNCIEVLLHFATPTGYTLEVRAVEYYEFTVGYVYSPEYYKLYRRLSLQVDSSLRRNKVKDKYVFDNAKGLADKVVDDYISLVESRGGERMKVVASTEWRLLTE